MSTASNAPRPCRIPDFRPQSISTCDFRCPSQVRYGQFEGFAAPARSHPRAAAHATSSCRHNDSTFLPLAPQNGPESPGLRRRMISNWRIDQDSHPFVSNSSGGHSLHFRLPTFGGSRLNTGDVNISTQAHQFRTVAWSGNLRMQTGRWSKRHDRVGGQFCGRRPLPMRGVLSRLPHARIATHRWNCRQEAPGQQRLRVQAAPCPGSS